MRKRNHRIVFYLNDAEFEALNKKVESTSLSRESVIRSAFCGVRINEAPPADYRQFIRELRRIGSNIDQILRIAYTKAPMQIPELKKALSGLLEIEDKIETLYFGDDI